MRRARAPSLGTLVLAGLLAALPAAPAGERGSHGGRDDDRRCDGGHRCDCRSPDDAEWRPVGKMRRLLSFEPRVTPLPGGRALVTGLEDPRAVLIFDPRIGPHGGFVPGRRAPMDLITHAAVALACGSVLVCGGGSDAILDDSAIYDAETGRWEVAADLPVPTYWLYGNPAVLLNDGRVWVGGGGSPDTSYEDTTLSLFFGAPFYLNLATRRNFIFDPRLRTWQGGRWVRGAWRQVEDMPPTVLFEDYAPRFFAAPWDIEWIRAGFGDEAVAAVPLGGPGTPPKRFLAGRAAFDALLLPDGQVFVSGGRSYGPGEFFGATEFVDIFDPCTERWRRASPMPPCDTDADGGIAGRYWPATALLGDSVLVSGGTSGALTFFPPGAYNPAVQVPLYALTWGPASRGVRSSQIAYDPASDTWRETGALPEDRFGHRMMPWSSGCGVFAIGGLNFCTDPETNEFTICPAPPTAFFSPASETWEHVAAEPDGIPPDGPYRTGAMLSDGTFLTVRRPEEEPPDSGELFEAMHDRFFPDGVRGRGRR